MIKIIWFYPVFLTINKICLLIKHVYKIRGNVINLQYVKKMFIFVRIKNIYNSGYAIINE